MTKPTRLRPSQKNQYTLTPRNQTALNAGWAHYG
jgi:hypothetical protein